MLQSQHSLASSNNKAKKNHSRKELLQWVTQQAASHDKNIVSSFNQNSLKNGVFFLAILQKIFPQQASSIKSKMKQKAVTQYDFEKNLLLVKKVLQKHALPANFEINQILKNKGCFDLLNYMKNINDGLINSSIEQMSKTSAQKMSSPEKKFPTNSGYKTGRQGSAAKSGQKTLSQAKSSRNYSASKTQNPFYKIKSGKNLVQIGNKEIQVLDNNRSHVVAQSKNKKSAYMSQFDSLDDCNEALYQLALEQNIQSFRSMLNKVKTKASQIQEGQTFKQYLNKIHNAIFGRN